MADLSEADCLYIQRHPLQPKIGHLREPLKKIVSLLAADSKQRDASPTASRESSDTEADSNSADDSEDVKDLLLDLLSALQSHRVAKKLRTNGSQLIAGEVATLFNRLISDRIDTTTFLPLVTVVTQESPSDIQTWKTVIQLVSSAQRRTPPPSQPSFSGTPRTLSSGSHQGSEQTKRLLNPVLRRELQGCTYEHVDGFYEKYFEREWTEVEENFMRQMKREYNNERWDGFPNSPNELAVWEWWSHLQEECLTNVRGTYYTTRSKKELTGTDTERQLDLLMKHRDAPSQGKHNWADVRVVGEHKCSRTNPNDKFLQLARYVRDIFKTQPTRRFVHAFLLLETTMEPFVFDRSGAYSGVPFDINEEPERFIQIFLGYSVMTDEELGLDTFMECQNGQRYVTVDGLDGEDSKRLQLEKNSIFAPSAIVCRGTTCYRTRDQRQVVKFSWRPDKRPPEAEHFRHAHAQGVEGIVQLVGVANVTSIADLRRGLTFDRKRKFRDMDSTVESFSQSQSFTAGSRVEGLSLQDGKRKSVDASRRPSKKSRSNSQASSLSQEVHAEDDSQTETQRATHASTVEDEPFRNRILTCLAISPAGRPLHQFEDIPELLRCLRDAIKAHRSLFIDGRILHRDISPNNIIITNPEDANGFHGMLIDLDLSTRVDASGKNERSGASRMTGTLKYMAIEVLELAFRDARADLDHTYRHDLESFFYVFLDLCINRNNMKSRIDPLQAWYIGSYEDIAKVKASDMGKRFFDQVLAKFSSQFDIAKRLARELRTILFGEGEINTTSPQDADGLYDTVLAAFDSASKTN